MTDFSKPNPKFDAWMKTQEEKLWNKFDLSACRMGFEAGVQSTCNHWWQPVISGQESGEHICKKCGKKMFPK